MDTVAVVSIQTTAAPVEVALKELLVRLHALYAVHRSAHWTVWGDSYYGDHLLFQRLYEPLDEEIDTLAERLVDQFGPDTVEPTCLTECTAELVACWCAEEPCPYARAERVEQELVACVNCCMRIIEESSDVPLGWDDFLGKVASTHESHTYLLGQRNRC